MLWFRQPLSEGGQLLCRYAVLERGGLDLYKSEKVAAAVITTIPALLICCCCCCCYFCCCVVRIERVGLVTSVVDVVGV
jgi:hypothetical protein